MTVLEFTKDNFEEEVLKSKDLVLIDFWASWCGPCKMFAPVIEDVAAHAPENLKVGKVNIDNDPDLAERYHVMSIPTLVLLKDGQPVSTSVGVQPKKAVLDMIEKAI